jgi:hypothetical protein
VNVPGVATRPPEAHNVGVKLSAALRAAQVNAKALCRYDHRS